MRVQDTFHKDPRRPIRSVVTANDEQSVEVEVDEYVLTNEVSTALAKVLEKYCETGSVEDIGIWLSGFYGSGKSHLLKMLAHILGDVDGATVPRAQVIASFVEKAKRSPQGEFLAGALKRTAEIPATALLFNISDEAQGGAEQGDSVLPKLYRVWNRMLGYSVVPGVAALEKELAEAGKLEEFARRYQELSGRAWTETRQSYSVNISSITTAFEETVGAQSLPAEGLYTKFSDPLIPAPVDFAEDVRRWLDGQEKGHRLILLIDEVGQFIGQNTQMMLSLQTIVEQFFKLDRRVWVAVTSQEDLDHILSRFNSAGEDFSKIMARFRNSFQLTSTSVKEVIQRRILDKAEAAKQALTAVWQESQHALDSLLRHQDGAKALNPYGDEIGFISTYPFVEWHFDLLQESIRGLSDRGAFTGSYQAVGGRTTLSIFRDALLAHEDDEVPTLVPFADLYSGISHLIRGPFKFSVDQVQNQGLGSTAVSLMQALLLVKYVPWFTATVENLATLLAVDPSESKLSVKKRVSDTLELLEGQAYIQRSGNEYGYLTNVEKDIEEEIRRTTVDDSETRSILRSAFDAAKLPKDVRYEPNQAPFKVGLIVDEVPLGPPKQLTIEAFSPAANRTLDSVLAYSGGRDSLVVDLGADSGLWDKIVLLAKADKYFKQSGSSSDEDKIAVIRERQRQIQKLRQEIDRDVHVALGSANLVHNGATLQLPSGDPRSRADRGLQHVISAVFHRLGDLGGKLATENDLVKAATAEDDALPLPAGPDEDVLNVLKLAATKQQDVTVNDLVKAFAEKPYGWPINSVRWIIASLAGRHEIVVRRADRPVVGKALAGELVNTSLASQLRVSIAKKVDAETRALLNDFAIKLGVLSPENELSTLVEQIKSALVERSTRCQAALDGGYPVANRLVQFLELVGDFNHLGSEQIVEQFAGLQPAILSALVDEYQPFAEFWEGDQLKIYERARSTVALHKNDLESGVAGNDYERLRELLSDEDLIISKQIPVLRKYHDEVLAHIGHALDNARESAIAKIDAEFHGISDSDQFSSAPSALREQVEQAVGELRSRVESARNRPEIAAELARLQTELKPLWWSWLNVLPDAEALAHQDARRGKGAASQPPISVSEVQVVSSAPQLLQTEEDVRIYVADLEASYLEAVKVQGLVR